MRPTLVGVEFARHARRRIRLYGIEPAQVEAVVAGPEHSDIDADSGRRRLWARVEGRTIRVVLAADDPNVVVTAFPEGE